MAHLHDIINGNRAKDIALERLMVFGSIRLTGLPPSMVLWSLRLHGKTIRYASADPDVCESFDLGSRQAYDLYQSRGQL